MFHGIIPLLAYLVLLLSAPYAQTHESGSLFAVGAAALILLFTGIHNSWDSVVFVSTGQHKKPDVKD